jgi:hypothetical protein
MIKLTHMISIINFIFTIIFYKTRWIKQDITCIYFKEFLNYLNLLYIYICLYLQQRTCELIYRIMSCDHSLSLKELRINLICSIFEYIYICNRSRVINTWANGPYYGLRLLLARSIYLNLFIVSLSYFLQYIFLIFFIVSTI